MGLQAFVLVASRESLPTFSEWDAQAGLPWKSIAATEGVWRFDGRALTVTDDPHRGTERRAPSAEPEPLAAVCEYLRQVPGVDAARAIAFPVLPTE
ncbi:hypothetical protein [Tautonia plasticadhaerens]|uniref:Uncharacterized protein n=1 Tax=Tautonia plasticadhaerens TaxID=2527974 RepID=A0A518GY07_9BACT|nr:hypothetical protein [Tautonia plasticadhaerens]QDV33465.1 hypothetical protein ElP_13370 [Tautonia plasticadhaerens]